MKQWLISIQKNLFDWFFEKDKVSFMTGWYAGETKAATLRELWHRHRGSDLSRHSEFIFYVGYIYGWRKRHDKKVVLDVDGDDGRDSTGVADVERDGEERRMS